MPKYIGLALDPETHDFFVGDDGSLAIVEDAEAVGQLAKQRLMTYLGEWFLDTQVGVPWFQEVFVRPFNELVTESHIKRTILNTRGVEELVAFEMRINWTIRQIDVVRADVRTEFDEVVGVIL
jgi:hypothetical protein